MGSHLETIIITGLSGSGKSTALKAFEDIGYFCVDNLPILLLPEFLALKEQELSDDPGPLKVAIVMDVREKAFLDQYQSIFRQVQDLGYHLEILFLEASDEVLIRRFSQTRRPHPLAPKGNLAEGIRFERQRLHGLKEWAHQVVDTSGFNVHQLRAEIIRLYAPREDLARPTIHLISFGFKHGVPPEANLMFDVRFLPNPYFNPLLRPLDGRQEAVKDFVLRCEEARRFLELIEDFLGFLLPLYHREGKAYMVIAVGCTGGRHRSVVVAEELRQALIGMGEHVLITHRDMDKD
ncbi:RNase adapter RapZ [Thermosulfuriphilus sp.]